MDLRKTIENDEDFLRQISRAVDFDGDDYLSVVAKLEDYCTNNKVYALAPVQIGFPVRIVYLKNTNEDMSRNAEHDYNERETMINPVILKMEGRTRFLEGCQSCMVDGKYIVCVVDRPYKCEVEYFDLKGQKHIELFEGFKATVFSHEYDHLNGILHFDRVQESSSMTLEEMKEYREKHPYEIVSKTGDFSYGLKRAN